MTACFHWCGIIDNSIEILNRRVIAYILIRPKLIFKMLGLTYVVDKIIDLQILVGLQNMPRANNTCHFTFWISLSLRLSPSPKFGLRPKISQKWSEVVYCLDSANRSARSNFRLSDR